MWPLSRDVSAERPGSRRVYGKVRFPRPALLWGLTLAAATAVAPIASLAAQTTDQVRVATPVVQPITDWDEYTGRFVPVESVDLNARIFGYLNGVNFVEGDIVEVGDVLYTIDARPYEAALAAAEARLQSAIATQSLAEIELERARTLLAREVGPEAEVQRRTGDYQRVVAEVALARAELRQSALDLEFTEIVAPISGRISRSNVDVGDLVIAGQNGGPTLATIVSVDPIEFEFTVSEAAFLRYTRLNHEGQRASARDVATAVYIQLMDQDDWSIRGEITFIDSRLDPNSGTLLVSATVPNPDEFIAPGVFARVRMARSAEYDGILVPEQSIVADQARHLVYIVDADNVVHERVVELGRAQGGLRIVRSGLEPDDRVIVSGVQRARPGEPVTPISVDLAFEAE